MSLHNWVKNTKPNDADEFCDLCGLERKRLCGNIDNKNFVIYAYRTRTVDNTKFWMVNMGEPNCHKDSFVQLYRGNYTPSEFPLEAQERIKQTSWYMFDLLERVQQVLSTAMENQIDTREQIVASLIQEMKQFSTAVRNRGEETHG